MKPYECEMDGCESKPVSRGLCNKHYLRLYRAGNMGPWTRKKKLCTVEGCSREHHTEGLCKTHSYHKRKGEGLCTSCGVKAASGIYCAKCNERSLWNRKLRRMGRSIKTMGKRRGGEAIENSSAL